MKTGIVFTGQRSCDNNTEGRIIVDNLIEIDAMDESDWKDVRRIYLEGIRTRNATFEQEVPSWEVWDNGHVSRCRFVARSEKGLMGWAALSPISSRCVYAGVGEVSVYVSQHSQGRGVGSRLLSKLIEESERHGFWTLQAGIFPENKVSLQLHKKLGFREVGRRERIGQMDGTWRDVLLLERRSEATGN